jgi:hypothetical protein
MNTNHIPNGYVTVPVKIDDNWTQYSSLMFAGHMNVEKADNMTLSLHLGWLITLQWRKKNMRMSISIRIWKFESRIWNWKSKLNLNLKLDRKIVYVCRKVDKEFVKLCSVTCIHFDKCIPSLSEVASKPSAQCCHDVGIIGDNWI